MSKRILLVEDEEHLQDIIKLNLEIEKYEVVLAISGKEALSKLRSERFDLCILDVMLPEIDGFTVCKTIRLENNQTPILFLTAKNSGSDRVEGLKIGGDDYLTKPFNLEELLLRIEKLVARSFRRTISKSLETAEFGANKIDFNTFMIEGVNVGKKEIGQREIKLLKLLIESENRVVSREEILETVWGYDVFPSTRTIDNYILAFRKYFEPNAREPIYFHSVRGVGYKFTS